MLPRASNSYPRIPHQHVLLSDLKDSRRQQQSIANRLIFDAHLPAFAGRRLVGRAARARQRYAEHRLERGGISRVWRNAVVEQIRQAGAACEGAVVLVGRSNRGNAADGLGLRLVVTTGEREEPAIELDLVL
jgi:hypothetical protein